MLPLNSIGFTSNLIHPILNGTKTLTYRLGTKYNFINVGDEINAHDSSTGKIFGRIKITEKSTTTFKDLPLDKVGHEIYATKQEQKKRFEAYYGQIQDDDKVLILGFTSI